MLAVKTLVRVFTQPCSEWQSTIYLYTAKPFDIITFIRKQRQHVNNATVQPHIEHSTKPR